MDAPCLYIFFAAFVSALLIHTISRRTSYHPELYTFDPCHLHTLSHVPKHMSKADSALQCEMECTGRQVRLVCLPTMLILCPALLNTAQAHPACLLSGSLLLSGSCLIFGKLLHKVTCSHFRMDKENLVLMIGSGEIY